MREISNHPVLRFERGKHVKFLFEGNPVTAYRGETVAMALYRNGIDVFSESPKLHRPRGMFCAIGKCSSCMMRVNGVPNVRTCILPVTEGMTVERQKGLGEKPSKAVKYPSSVTEKEKVVIIGSGPAGLSAAITLAENGIAPLIVEQNPNLGGQLIKQTHKFFGSERENAGKRGIDIASEMVESIEKLGVKVYLNSTAFGFYEGKTLGVFAGNKLVKIRSEYFIFATGAAEKMIPFEGNDIPGVFGAGAAQTMMNVYGIKPGENVLMVGSGNVGLIVSYQMLQAGINVKAVIEAAPRIGGYFVHAAKIRRFGVPVYTSTTIKKAIGERRVEKAVIVSLNGKFEEIQGTEKVLDVDTVCLATGLIPSVNLLAQSDVRMKYVSALGGYVPLRNKYLKTSLTNVYVAGDVTGIEEASTAILEGKIAAYSILSDTGKDVGKELSNAISELSELRSGPFGAKIVSGIKEVQYE